MKNTLPFHTLFFFLFFSVFLVRSNTGQYGVHKKARGGIGDRREWIKMALG